MSKKEVLIKQFMGGITTVLHVGAWRKMVMYDSRLPRLTEMTQKIFNTVGSSKNKRNAVFRNMDQATGNLCAASDFIFRTLDRVTSLHSSAPWTETGLVSAQDHGQRPRFYIQHHGQSPQLYLFHGQRHRGCVQNQDRRLFIQPWTETVSCSIGRIQLYG